MKAVAIQSFGSPEGLAVIDPPDPSPARRAGADRHGVDTSWAGRRVWAFTGPGGGYVEQAIAPVGEILPLPANLSPSMR